MKQFVMSRPAALVAAAALVVITACSDSGSTQPGLTGPNASSSNGPGGSGKDTAKSGGPRDSTHTPKPVAKFALTVHVGTPRPGSTDTLTTDPVTGATVSVIQESYTFATSPGSDTVHITNTVVATGSSDANGLVTFPDLNGAGVYIIRADPPAGSALGPATMAISQVSADAIKLQLTLHGR